MRGTGWSYRRRLPQPHVRWRAGLATGLQIRLLLSVCTAGEDVLGPYLKDRKAFMHTVRRPLQDKEETSYVLRAHLRGNTPSAVFLTNPSRRSPSVVAADATPHLIVATSGAPWRGWRSLPVTTWCWSAWNLGLADEAAQLIEHRRHTADDC